MSGLSNGDNININGRTIEFVVEDTLGAALVEYAQHKIDSLGYTSLAADVFGAPMPVSTPTLYTSSDTWTIQSADGLTLSGVHYAPASSTGKWVVLIDLCVIIGL